MYNEIIQKLDEILSSKEISQKFKETPAYQAALEQIIKMIPGNYEQQFLEKLNQGDTSFKLIGDKNAVYSCNISSNSPENFNFEIMHDDIIYNPGETIKTKDASKMVATIDEKSGFMDLDVVFGHANNKECEPGCRNNSVVKKHMYYTDQGIMRDKITSEYGYIYNEYRAIENVSANDILYVGLKNVIEPERETRVYRDKLDTARVVVSEKNKGITFSAVLPLSTEHGLRDMGEIGANAYVEYIPEISQEETEQLIQLEPNPIVQEGLRVYARGRETYHYDPNEDTSLVVSDNVNVTSKPKTH